MMSAAVDSALSQLFGSEKKSDGEENKKPSQAYSTNADKKLHLKFILNKSK